MSDWRQRLYDAYVSSGQAQIEGGDARNRFQASGPFFRKVIERHVPADRSVVVLDLGCGAGGFLFWLQEAGYKNLQGVDVSPEMVAAAHAAGMACVRQGDLAGALSDLEPSTIDVVVIFDVLEHLDRQELFDTVDLVYRVLKPGGRILGHVPNAEGVFGSRVRWGDLTHELAFTQTSVRQLLRASGFETVQCFEDKPVARGPKSVARAVVWAVGSFWYRVLHASETGVLDVILTQNLTFVGVK